MQTTMTFAEFKAAVRKAPCGVRVYFVPGQWIEATLQGGTSFAFWTKAGRIMQSTAETIFATGG